MHRIIVLIPFLFFQPLSANTAEEDAVPTVSTPSTVTSVLTAAETPWGRFPPSSWILMETVTVQTNAEGKKTRSITEKKTTLVSVEKDGYTLEETDTVNYGGRLIQKALVIRRFDFFQQPISLQATDNMEITAGEPEKLVIDRLLIPCEKRIYQQETPQSKHKTTVWYSSQLYPYIFRVEKVQKQETAGQPPVTVSKSVSEVHSLSVFKLRRGRAGSCQFRTVRKSGNITTVIETACEANLPGGIRKRTIREFDQTGKEIRLLESRLINYYLPAELPPDGIGQTEMLIYDKSRLRLQKKAD
ncbi:MAG: hypothetical protein FWE67_13000 [Planctomycetaceae bacterium]|nr:hypothetical protein [Planctomycetaceae bacterium]